MAEQLADRRDQAFVIWEQMNCQEITDDAIMAWMLLWRAEINFAYPHIFVDDPKVNKAAVGEDLSRGALVGEWEASVDVVSLNFNYAF